MRKVQLMKPFALVALAALALAGCGSDDGDDTAAPQPTTVTVTETATTPAETEPQVECSTAGLRLTLPEQDLPPEVADVRERIFGAALACDYDELERIAVEKGEGFTFSYGASADASEYWSQLEESAAAEPKPMRTLATILTMPFTRNESGSYAWPTAYNESPTDEAWQALVDAGLYSQEQIDQMKTGGTGYLGYRTAITADGDWQFFVAGD
jgi:hypothetical protein